MNLYEKLQQIKVEILNSNLKKTGKNKFTGVGFEYFELCDILPTIINSCNKHKVYTQISFTKDLAILKAINCEDANEQIEITSPMEELELKGCNKVQALGGVETYQRRYLYLSLFDITESDMFDSTIGNDKPNLVKNTKYYCETCKSEIQPFTTDKGAVITPQQLFELSKNKFGKGLCTECANKLKEENGGKNE